MKIFTFQASASIPLGSFPTFLPCELNLPSLPSLPLSLSPNQALTYSPDYTSSSLKLNLSVRPIRRGSFASMLVVRETTQKRIELGRALEIQASKKASFRTWEREPKGRWGTKFYWQKRLIRPSSCRVSVFFFFLISFELPSRPKVRRAVEVFDNDFASSRGNENSKFSDDFHNCSI